MQRRSNLVELTNREIGLSQVKLFRISILRKRGILVGSLEDFVKVTVVHRTLRQLSVKQTQMHTIIIICFVLRSK